MILPWSLHRDALHCHLLQTADDVLQYEYCQIILHQRAVLGDVTGKALQVKAVALEDAAIVHTVVLGLGVGVLDDVNQHRYLLKYCHNCEMFKIVNNKLVVSLSPQILKS